MALPEHFSSYPNLDTQITLIHPDPFAVGGLGDLYRGEWKSPVRGTTAVAVKTIRGLNLSRDKELMEKRLKRESSVWKSIVHDNILPFYGICSDVHASYCLVSLYCDFGHVMAYLGEHPDADRMAMVRGIAGGVAYLHSRQPENIIHGDLKPQNIVIDDQGSPRICDFGRAKIIGHQGYTTASPGTYRYLAPELSDDSDETPRLTLESDVYSLSMVIWEVITGKIPLSGKTDTQAMVAVVRGTRPKRNAAQSTLLSDELWELLEKCWMPEPAGRPVARKVAQELSRL